MKRISLSLFIVLALFGCSKNTLFDTTESKPQIEILNKTEGRTSNGKPTLEVEIRNSGEIVAKNVTLRAKAKSGNQVIDNATCVFPGSIQAGEKSKALLTWYNCNSHNDYNTIQYSFTWTDNRNNSYSKDF